MSESERGLEVLHGLAIRVERSGLIARRRVQLGRLSLHTPGPVMTGDRGRRCPRGPHGVCGAPVKHTAPSRAHVRIDELFDLVMREVEGGAPGLTLSTRVDEAVGHEVVERVDGLELASAADP